MAGGGGGSGIKDIVKLVFAAFLWAAFLMVTLQFSYHRFYRHYHAHIGWIFYWIFFLIGTGIGVAACFFDNPVVTVVFIVLYLILVLVYGLKIYAFKTCLIASLALGLGAVYGFSQFTGG